MTCIRYKANTERTQRLAKYDAVPAGDSRPGNFMEDLWRDLRYAVRTMRKGPCSFCSWC